MSPNAALLHSLGRRAMSEAPYPDDRFPPSPYYRFLRLLAETVRPQLSVELGLCGGGGSFHLALGWPQGTVVGVEISEGDQHQRDNWQFLQENCPNFVLWRGDSVKSAPGISNRYGQVDVLFLDTEHTYVRTIAEWLAWRPYLSKQAILCLDDLYRPGVERAWNEIVGERKMRLDYLHLGADPNEGGGFGVIWGVK